MLVTKSDLEHAQWRVRFLSRLLDIHRATPRPGDQEWLLEEADFLQQISMAEARVKYVQELLTAIDQAKEVG